MKKSATVIKNDILKKRVFVLNLGSLAYKDNGLYNVRDPKKNLKEASLLRY